MRRASWKLVDLNVAVCVAALALVGANALAEEESDVAAETGPTFDDFFRQGEISQAVLSPNGEYVVYRHYNMIRGGNAEIGYHDLTKIGSETEILEMAWSGNDVLVIHYHDYATGRWGLAVRKLGMTDDGFDVVDTRTHYTNGYIDDPLPDQPDTVIFAKVREEKDYIATDLFRVNLFEDIYPQTRFRRRINKGANDLFYYLDDADGNLLAGVSYIGGAPQLWYRTGSRGKWEQVWAAPDETTFEPIAVSADGSTLWALSNVTTDTTAAVAFDLASASITDIVFEHERYDILDIIMADDGSGPAGVTYMDSGLYRYRFFDQQHRDELDAIETKFEGQGVTIVGESYDGSSQLVYASSPGNPGSIHHCGAADEPCELVAKTRPWLDNVDLASTLGLKVESTDDLIIDAFLTMPPSGGDSIPLIAMPHGGPIGVADDKYYSGDIQWLAQNGYAVLQVNYRGSSGYGRRFLEAGLKQRGRGIEDDVEAAVRQALRDYPQLDAGRVGIFGSSYGGYSALVSVIETPELYKCAASFAAVTDLTLRFNRSGFRDDDEVLEFLIESIGDPENELDELKAYSPVYQYERIDRPVFIAHGNNDAVVDVEHSWRLRKMLLLIGKDPEFHVFEDVGHSFAYISEAKALYDPLIEFLDTHLKP